MKLNRFQGILNLAAALIALTACSPDPRSGQATATACAVYEAILQDLDTDMSAPEDPPAVVLAAATSSAPPDFPPWDRWRPTRDFALSDTAELALVELISLNDGGVIDCTLEALPHWSAIRGDQRRSGWIRSPGTFIDGNGYAELRLSPVYLSPDGRVAMVATQIELIGVPSGTPRPRHPLGQPSFRLETDDEGVWVVTGKY
tara:strand:- start:125 stop:730 length:606 start_codon:yes stop_codon:yes gene_type:complete